MKHLILLLLFFVAVICNAQEVERNTEDEEKFRVLIDANEWEKTGITADEKTRFYTRFFSKAIESPDSLIRVSRYEETLKLIPFFKRLVEIEEHFILYNDINKKIHYIGPKKREEVFTSLLILPVLLSFILMTISILLRIYKKKGILPFFWLTASSTFLTYLLSIPNFYWASILFLFALVSFVPYVSFIVKKKGLKIPIILYYLFLVSGSIFLFIGS